MLNRIAAARPKDLHEAVREAGVVWMGLFALGIGFGVLVTSHGLPWWLAPIISATTLAGSVEFLLAGMLATTAPIAAVALTTFLVNSRHLFYGLSFPAPGHRAPAQGLQRIRVDRRGVRPHRG
jgi:predicted branched-subunit amino acid permease